MRTRPLLPRKFRLGGWLALLCLAAFLPSALAKARPDAASGAGYASALAAADQFLQAWRSGDIESGMVLLSSHAKSASTSESVQNFFSNPANGAFEITRGRWQKDGRYEFSVVLVSLDQKNGRSRRRFATLMMVSKGKDDWEVDQLP